MTFVTGVIVGEKLNLDEVHEPNVFDVELQRKPESIGFRL